MPQTTTEPASQRSAYKMAAMLIAIGVGHFAAPKPFDTLIPAELPGSPRFYTLASGVAEVGVGGLLLIPRTRRFGAAAAVALFLAVFPANVNMVRLWKGVPMIVQALKIRRNAPLRGLPG